MPFSIFKNRPKLQRKVEFSIKLVILLLLFASLYWQIVRKDDVENVLEDVLAIAARNSSLILLVLALMFANWGLEAWKWWLLINRAEPLSFGKAFLAIFCGATLTLFTPNRVGEYGGRFIFLANPLRLQTLQATVLGSIAQIWVTILAGLVGMAWWLARTSNLSADLLPVLYGVVIVLAGLTTYLYFRWEVVLSLLGRIKYLQRYQDRWVKVLHFSTLELLKVLLLAALRYGVYTAQFLLLLYAFEIEINPWHGAALIATVFLFQTAIPSIAIFDLGIRGNLAVFIFSGFVPYIELVIAAAFCLWLINLVLPALIGYVIIVATKMFKSS